MDGIVRGGAALTGAPDLRAVQRHARDRLRAGGVGSADLDARLLVAAAIAEEWTVLVSHPERSVSARERALIDALIARRLSGEPVSRILGEREFWGLGFEIGPATLDPRPDTETLIERCLEIAHAENWQAGAPAVLDLGTGSGCILVALLSEWPGATGIGTDRSHEALTLARANAGRHGLQGRSAFLCGDWDEALGGSFDIIVSNPPYIPSADICGLAREVADHDPRGALDGGADGLDAYRRIVPAAAKRLRPGGWLAVEVGAGQADAVADLFAANGLRPGAGLGAIARDLAQRGRVVSMQRPPLS